MYGRFHEQGKRQNRVNQWLKWSRTKETHQAHFSLGAFALALALPLPTEISWLSPWWPQVSNWNVTFLARPSLTVHLKLQPDPHTFLLSFFILLYNTVLVLPYINMNPPRVYTCSQSWTPLPPPSPYHLSGSSQCTSPKHPVSCIEPRLVIHFLYDIIHVSMPFSQIIPPSPSPTESKSLFFTSV